MEEEGGERTQAPVAHRLPHAGSGRRAGGVSGEAGRPAWRAAPRQQRHIHPHPPPANTHLLFSPPPGNFPEITIFSHTQN